MDRAEFLNICQKVAVLPNGAGGFKANVPKEYVVMSKGISFYPMAYAVAFDDRGNTKHIAVLHDLKVNSVFECDLKEVKRREGA